MNALGNPRVLPQGVVLAFYGDDFTGSASTMEIMAFAGLPTVMFLDIPRPDRIARFSGYRCIGIAGVARSRSPQWMDDALPGYYRALANLGAPITHYKVCSTFDSAPHIGSIGRAIELADGTFGDGWRPLLVAAPQIGRYQVFGNLYAAVSGIAYRLDRHPVMARHPVTPMDEADVRRHLAKQINARIGLIDVVSIKQGRADEKLSEELAEGSKIVALDVLDDETLVAAGRLLWESCGERAFVAGSQGVEYALVAYWRSEGLLDAEPRPAPRARPVDRIACVSGSCSPVTAAQIEHAIDSGFAAIRLEAACAVDERKWQRTIQAATERALDALGQGRDPLVFTALGPDDPAVGAVAAAVEASGAVASVVNDRVGSGLGLILDEVMRRSGVSRGAIAGGDTSGHAVQATGAFALTAVASIAPGTPLCRAHADSAEHDGREIALKGGQLGGIDFFSAVRAGGANA